MLVATDVGSIVPPPAYFEPNVTVKLSNDCILRFKSMPAGTHWLAVAYEAAKRLLGSKLAVYVPQVCEFTSLVPKHQEILADPAKYHIGAYYLTGNLRADYNDLDHSAVMGCLGSYIRVFMSASTLANSPHFTQEKIESYPDYNADWNAFLMWVRAASTHATCTRLEELNQLETSVHPSLFKTLIGQFSLTVSPGQAALLASSDDEDSQATDAEDEQPLASLVEEPSVASRKRTKERAATSVAEGRISWQEETNCQGLKCKCTMHCCNVT